MFYKFHPFLLLFTATKYTRHDWRGALTTLREKSISISYLNKKEPENEITVFCHLISLVFSSPHKEKFTLPLTLIKYFMLLSLSWSFCPFCSPVSGEGKKKTHLTLLLLPAFLCSGFVLKINFHVYLEPRKPLQKRPNPFFFPVYVIVFYFPKRLMFEMNNG